MHLRMTGNLILLKDGGMLDPAGRRLYEGERSISERHLRARFWLADSSQLWFTDPRRFGEAFLIDDVELPRRFERLGVEPLSAAFTPQLLGEIAAARTAPLKSFLLDQSAIAGSAISTPMRRSFGPAFIRSARPDQCASHTTPRCAMPSSLLWRRGSRGVAHRLRTTATAAARGA